MSASRVSLFEPYVRRPLASRRSMRSQAYASPFAARIELICETVVSSLVVAVEILPRKRSVVRSSRLRGHDVGSGRTRRLIMAGGGPAGKAKQGESRGRN